MTPQRLVAALHLDGAANIGMGVVALLAAPWLATQLTIGVAAFHVVGLVFVANGIANHLVAMRRVAAGLPGLAAVDLVFAVAVLAVVAAGAAASSLVMAILFALALASAGFGALKLAGRAALGRQPVGAR